MGTEIGKGWVGRRREKSKQDCDINYSSVQSLSSVQTLCDPMNHSTPDLPVHHQLPESTQTHVHWVGDAIQPSHPLPSPSARVQSWWIQGDLKVGTESASLEITYLITDREGLES